MNWIQRQFLALYEEDLPREAVLADRVYRHVHTFKYDFFAGTGLYEISDDNPAIHPGVPRRIVVKIYRRRRFFGLPCGWFGKLSVLHEARLYRLLGGIEGIPRFEGFVGKTGFAHEFVPGNKLHRKDFVNDLFFDRFERMLKEVHARHVAYVDLNKPENVLLGEDRKPYLIDFQISYAPRRWFPPFRTVTGWILAQFQREDWYHFIKHKRRMRKDLLTQADYDNYFFQSLPVRLHRKLARPYFQIRHRIMERLGLKSVE